MPLGRTASADEQAAILVFLNSAEASYLTGQVIWADGGYSAGMTVGALPHVTGSVGNPGVIERISYLAHRNPAFASRGDCAALARALGIGGLAARIGDGTALRAVRGAVRGAPTTRTMRSRVPSTGLPEARVANREATGYHAVMREDELKVFDRGIVECSFIGTFHALIGRGGGPFKVVRFLRGRDHRFAEFWSDWAAWLEDRPHGLLGYAQNRAIDPPTPAGWGLPGRRQRGVLVQRRDHRESVPARTSSACGLPASPRTSSRPSSPTRSCSRMLSP